MSRPGNPRAKSELLRAAERVFAEHGLDRAKVEDITQLAGVSKGAFYLHFASKGAAFTELISGVLEHLRSLLDDAKTNCLSALQQGLEPFLENKLERDLDLFEFIWKNRGLVRITLEGGGSAEYHHLIEHFAAHAQSETVSLLRQGIVAGIYRPDMDVELAATFLAGGYDRFARQLVRERRKPDLRRRLAELQWLVMGGLATTELASAVRKLQGPEAVNEAPNTVVRSTFEPVAGPLAHQGTK